MADVIKEALELIERRAARSDSNDTNEDDDEAAQEAKDYLEVLKDDLEENKGAYAYLYMYTSLVVLCTCR